MKKGLRPAHLLLAWKTLKHMGLHADSDPNDRFNAYIYVHRSYGLTSDEDARLWSELWENPNTFEATLQKALDRGKLIKPRRKPAIGSRWLRLKDRVECKVKEAGEDFVELDVMGGIDCPRTSTFFKEYTPLPEASVRLQPVKAKHRKFAASLTPTAVGRDTMAQAIANADHSQDGLSDLLKELCQST